MENSILPYPIIIKKKQPQKSLRSHTFDVFGKKIDSVITKL